MDTKDLREDSLEQVAAYCGYRPWREFVAMRDELARLRADRERLRAALTEIAKGSGPYSRDALEHAENVIDESKRLAREALSEPTPGGSDHE